MSVERRSQTEVRETISASVDSLLYKDIGKSKPYVCLICDRLLQPGQMKLLSKEVLEKQIGALRYEVFNDPRNDSLEACYLYDGREAEPWMHGCPLSPRSGYVNTRAKRGFVTCSSCCTALGKSSMPKFAIANNLVIGEAPPCLLALNEVEIALITPVKTYGYLFTYTGGKQVQLQGTLSLMRVKVSSIARAVAQLDALSLNQHIVVLFNGKMTSAQKAKAFQSTRVRTDFVIEAVRWLCVNHRSWVHIDFNELINNLPEPVFVDKSSNEEGSDDAGNGNIEDTECFSVYFPDGSVTQVNGGQEGVEKFRTLVEKSKAKLCNIAFQCQLVHSSCNDYQNDNLVNACPLQFPYGTGGLNENRLKHDGSDSNSVDIKEYVKHLSYLSLPQFHRPVFMLHLFNLHMKQSMLRSASLRVRGEQRITDLLENITVDNIQQAIDDRTEGRRDEETAGTAFLHSVDAVSASLPHSNDAAKRARTEAECMQHELGLAAYFITATLDDENSYLIQVYCGVEIDDDRPIESLSDAELQERCRLRKELRIKFPGLAAYNFEVMLGIILIEVAGWDWKSGKATEKDGLLGKCIGVLVAIEEQGRKTLHAHIEIWIEGHAAAMERLRSPIDHVHRAARAFIEKEFDRVATTKFMDLSSEGCRKRVFAHDGCANDTVIEVANDQQIRTLRHIKGYSETDGYFVHCPTCERKWTYEELVEAYLIRGLKIEGLTSFPDNLTGRLYAMAIESQKPGGDECSASIINAAYNAHSSSHCFGCFPCNKKKRKFKDTDDECNKRLPDRKRTHTVVLALPEKKCWYSWDGIEDKERETFEILPRRNTYDLFQNTSCAAISESKMTCNTNAALLMPGPIPMYVTKYNTKPTQKDDSSQYTKVSEMAQKILSEEERVHENDRSEALRYLLRASFAHTSANVASAPMAAWLVRHDSRFIFSHEFAWCPLHDFVRLLKQEGELSINVKYDLKSREKYWENIAIHYFCRPTELEALHVKAFYELYEVVQRSRLRRGALFRFVNTDFCNHPSIPEEGGTSRQGVRERTNRQLLKITQWIFPDSAQFGASMLVDTVAITDEMEKLAMLVLILFLPFRSNDDLTIEGSYVKKLRQLSKEGFLTESITTYLQNIQDTRANCLRYGRNEDDLQRDTTCYEPVVIGPTEKNAEEDDIPDEMDDDHGGITDFLHDLDLQGNTSEAWQETKEFVPASMSFKRMISKGLKACGTKLVPEVELPQLISHSEPFVDSYHATSSVMEGRDPGSIATTRKPNVDDIVRVIIENRTVRSREVKATKVKDAKLMDANGSIESILNWGVAAELDGDQRRAFEAITSAFVLTFYDEAAISSGRTGSFRREHNKLTQLAMSSNRRDNQLLLFLHGPGGSGKTSVLDLVIEYAREYCNFLKFLFTSRTIVVTALTGVAATLLLGETVHSAAYCYKGAKIEGLAIQAWTETRMVIVDEISFAQKSIIEYLDTNLRKLKQCSFRKYGGVNIVFSGDFRQLEPIGKKLSLYYNYIPQFHDWINCYIELNGLHRYKLHPEWGLMLLRFRNGVPTYEDIRLINDTCFVPTPAVPRFNNATSASNDVFPTPPVKCLPKNIRCATSLNSDRDAINTAVFEKYCKQTAMMNGGIAPDAIIILCDTLTARNSDKRYTKFNNPTYLWQNCGEADIKVDNIVKPRNSENKGSRSGRMDPAVKLFRNCPVMMTHNMRVSAGLANGTSAIVTKVVLKQGERPRMMEIASGVRVQTVLASQVLHLELKHNNDRVKPIEFNLTPQTYYFTATMPEVKEHRRNDKDVRHVHMKGKQLPVVSNTATTGYKLQGSGVEQLFVHGWNYTVNWPYVMLSRVKTMIGLFCRDKLSYDLTKYAVPEAYTTFIAGMQDRLTLPLTPDEYADLLSTY